MSLGLENAGFDLVFANELSPMAGETYAYNLLGNSLSENKFDKVLWLGSNYNRNDIESRLRENPFEAEKGEFSDMELFNIEDKKLLIGNVDLLLEKITNDEKIQKSLVELDVDLISGGPPCQSFSLAGKRIKNDSKNLLPLSFARLTGLIKPKVVLLENVKGITSPFKEEGNKYYAWLEVSKAFSLEGYVPVCMMLNSKYFGVPQNRPRFILQAFREDVFDKIFKTEANKTILKKSKTFYDLVNSNREELDNVNIKDFKYYDIENEPEYFDGTLLPKISHFENSFIGVNEAIGDIRRTDIDYTLADLKGSYIDSLNESFKSKSKNKTLKNHEPRTHSFTIKSRFRFYQVISEFRNGLKKSATELFTGKKVSDEDKERLIKEFSNYNLLFRDSRKEEFYKKPKTIIEVEKLIDSIPTKKHSQRALKEFEPAPAQLTIPDDICHYHIEQPRTLTVREMARIQSFPDWFEFRSKVTTGGKMRKFEVPQYTQVGNAVPPLLALSLGKNIEAILRKIEKNG